MLLVKTEIYNGSVGTVSNTKHKNAHWEVSSIQANETIDLSRPKSILYVGKTYFQPARSFVMTIIFLSNKPQM